MLGLQDWISSGVSCSGGTDWISSSEIDVSVFATKSPRHLPGRYAIKTYDRAAEVHAGKTSGARLGDFALRLWLNLSQLRLVILRSKGGRC